MSQHYLNTVTSDGRKVGILTGWDRPLKGFFLVIQQSEPVPDMDDESEGILFSNLSDMPFGSSHPKEFDAFTETLNRFGIVLPKAMMDDLHEDRANNAGNKQVLWSPTGEILNG